MQCNHPWNYKKSYNFIIIGSNKKCQLCSFSKPKGIYVKDEPLSDYKYTEYLASAPFSFSKQLII